MLAFAVVGIIGAWAFWRRKHRNAMRSLRAWPDEDRGGSTPGGEKPDAYVYGSRHHHSPRVGRAAEVPAFEQPREMSGVARPAEMLQSTAAYPVEHAAELPVAGFCRQL